jgi:hypothetical protein
MPDKFNEGGVEPEGGGYTPIAISTSGGAEFSDPDVSPIGETQNLSDLLFPKATSTWGLIVGCAVFLPDSPREMLLRGTLREAVLINATDVFRWRPGDFIFEVV